VDATVTGMTVATPTLARNTDFSYLFAAAAVNRLGTSVSYVAMPLVAVTSLDATPGQVGLLGALATAAFLIIGLPAGAWTDRLRRRRVLIAADLVRAMLFGSVPVAWALDVLTITQLYGVVLLTGVATVFSEVAGQSYLPQIVGRDNLLAANARLVSMNGVNDIAGRGVAGYLVAVVAAPVAVLVDAVSYLVSALLVARVRHREDGRELVRSQLWREVGEGVRFVTSQPILRAIALAGALTNLSLSLVLTMLPVHLVRELGLSAAVLGPWLAGGGVGALLGSLVARRLADRFGAGRVLLLAGIAIAPLGFAVPAATRETIWFAAAAWLLVAAKIGVDNVLKTSFRQRVTPDRLLGRVNATFRFLLTGALAIGAAGAGLLGELTGPGTALWAGAAGLALVWVPIAVSPLRALRELPA
jgi:MFS family permease